MQMKIFSWEREGERVSERENERKLVKWKKFAKPRFVLSC